MSTGQYGGQYQTNAHELDIDKLLYKYLPPLDIGLEITIQF